MAGLTAEQMDRFQEDGYLIVEDVLPEVDLAAVEDEYREIVARSKGPPRASSHRPREWANLWWDARDRIADGVTPMHLNARWAANSHQPICA